MDNKNDKSSNKWSARARDVLDSPDDNFLDLIKVASLDTKKHLRYADWSGIDFSNCDLRGFDFTGARLINCNFSNALINNAIFHKAELCGSNLCEAKDWKQYRINMKEVVPKDIQNNDIFVLAICTRSRSNQLKFCLQSLEKLEIPEGVDFQIVVVDNDIEPSAKNVVSEFKRNSERTVIYEHEPDPGIPQARNKSLNLALEIGANYVGFIDDDAEVSPSWLKEMLKSFNHFGCDVVQGNVDIHYGDRGPFNSIIRQYSARLTGTPLRTATTNNVVIAKRLFAPKPLGLNLRFDPKMRFTGGSDTQFFFDASDVGASIIWSNKAVVSEFLPKSRATALWQLRRSYRTEVNSINIYSQRFGLFNAGMKYVPKILYRILLCFILILLSFLILIFSRSRSLKLACLAGKNIASAFGAFSGLLGLKPLPYKIMRGD